MLSPLVKWIPVFLHQSKQNKHKHNNKVSIKLQKLLDRNSGPKINFRHGKKKVNTPSSASLLLFQTQNGSYNKSMYKENMYTFWRVHKVTQQGLSLKINNVTSYMTYFHTRHNYYHQDLTSCGEEKEKKKRRHGTCKTFS